jgi:uncharacterized membrane protein YpjA
MKASFEWLIRWILDILMRVPFLFWICVTTNLIGSILGTIFWYGPMLLTSPVWALPFIPDCPLAALLATIALFGIRSKKRWAFLYTLTTFACIKYGIWTILFWVRQWVGSGEITLMGFILFVSHIGLFVEGMLFVPHMGTISLLKRILLISWFGLSIFVDYGLGYDPGMASHVPRSFAFLVAFVLTATLGTGLLLMPYRSIPADSQIAGEMIKR